MDKEQYKFYILQGLLLEYVGSDKAKNYMAIQFLIMFLFSQSSGVTLNKLGTDKFKEIGTAYPAAVEMAIGDQSNLDKINVPQITNPGKIPEVWNSLSQEDQFVIQKIYKKLTDILKSKATNNAG